MPKDTVNQAFGDIAGMFNSAVILAGGYVRDSALGKEVKDADFFAPFATLTGRTSTTLRERGWERVRFSGYDRSPDIERVYRNTQRYELPVELILVSRSPIKFVEQNFDWGVCKCYMKFNGDVVFTPHFQHDVEREVHTLNYDEKLHNAYTVLKHLKRISVKYPWTSEVRV